MNVRTVLRILSIGAALMALACDDDSSADGDTVSPVQGTLTLVDGGAVLTLRGTHEQRGYAHGYLAGHGAKQVFDSMFVDGLFSSNDSLYDVARTFVTNRIEFENEARIEAGALVRGMVDAGTDPWNGTLGRAIDSVDVLVMNCLEELYTSVPIPLGCSSLSSWGAATQSDSSLNGETVITRHWDYARYPSMIDNLMLIAHEPSEADEQRWVCAGWAGVIGSCSGMNESGVGAFLNYGIVDTLVNPGPYRAVSFALRMAIERRDYNGDGRCGTSDVVASFGERRVYFPAIIHVVAPVAADSHALIIEVNNHRGVHVRDSSNSTGITGPHLVATNHFRVLYSPVACDVYARARDSLSADNRVSAERSASLLGGAGGWIGTIYRVQFVPSSRTIRWSCWKDGVPAYQRALTQFALLN